LAERWCAALTVAAMRILLSLGLVALLALAGCGGSSKSNSSQAPSPNGAEVSPSGDIPDNQAFVAFAVPKGGVSVKVPEGWARSSGPQGIAFTDKLNSITVKVVPATRSGAPTHRSFLAQSKPDPVTGKTRTNAVERWGFFHKGKELILTLSGPKGADNVDPWKIVTDSVRWTR
jgi:hypothetical protein